MAEEFYRTFGWDEADGRPVPERLKSLGMDELIQAFYPVSE